MKLVSLNFGCLQIEVAKKALKFSENDDQRRASVQGIPRLVSHVPQLHKVGKGKSLKKKKRF